MYNWKLFLLLLLVVVVVLGIVGAASYTYQEWKSPVAEAESEFSFKEFTLEQFLRHDLEVDLKTSGTIVKTPKLETLEKNVSEIRELPIKEPIRFRECSEELIRFTIMKETEEESPEGDIEADEKLLVALGLFPKGESLEKTVTDVYTEQIAGFYDPETKDITLVKGKDTGDVMDELTLAHETCHALQDQNFGLEQPPLQVETYNGDNDLAVESLIEGDATMTMVLYARQYIDPSRLTPEAFSAAEESSKELDAAPPYIRKALLFPYEEGFTFAEKVYGDGEFAKMDASLRDPPLSSEQIIHPDTYLGPDDKNPIAVPLADISASLGADWKKINEDCLGEFDYEAWFEQYSGALAAEDASQGWAGNTIQYFQGPGKRYSLVSLTLWDTSKDSLDFFDLYEELLADRFKGKEKKAGSGDDWYLYEADRQLFYCAMSGESTLMLQARDRDDLVNTLKNYPTWPQVP
ncbi:MAG: hypothetical protein V1748_08170 [Actinomycetota bacterium]